MDVADTIRSRRSIRKFSSRPVDESLINDILEAAGMAPSASNTQPWRFVVVREEEQRMALAAAARGQKAVATAPVVIVACGDRTAVAPLARMKRWAEFVQAGMEEEMKSTGVVYAVNEIMVERQETAERKGKAYVTDVTLAANVSVAMSFMSLRIHELGLGSCWIGAFSTEEARKVVSLPDSMDVLWLLPVGYPDISPVDRPRRPVEDIVRYETWGNEQ